MENKMKIKRFSLGSVFYPMPEVGFYQQKVKEDEEIFTKTVGK
jgi:hypothetical protein